MSVAPGEDHERLLDGAALLGAELDTEYRVLGLTIEPAPGRHPHDPGRPEDRRLQVLCSPASTVLASLRRQDGDQTVVETFSVEQLPLVVDALAEPTLHPPFFGQPQPRPGEWGPDFSVEGRSNAPDGQRHTLRFGVEGRGRRLDLFVRFDEIAVVRPDGTELEPPFGGAT